MRNGPWRIDEFKIARVFGAIAVLVALYGVALSAAALVEQPVATVEHSPKWYERAEPAIQPKPESTTVGGRGISFWSPAEPGVPTLHPSAEDGPTRIGSFWAKRDAAAPVARVQLASGAKQVGERF